LLDHFVYDTETTDLDVHAQVVQYASIRAAEDFAVVSEDELLIKRLPYVVPAPAAMAVTGLTTADLDDQERITEYMAAGQIERIVRPRFGRKQINITYNGVKFDDEQLRLMLFRNLRNPWFSSGRDIRRLDLLPLVRLLHTINKDLIAIRKNEKDQLSWKLSDVCTANGIDISAHDAMEDVRGTLALARMIKSKAPTIWAEAVNCGNAANAESRLADQLARGAPAWVFTFFGKPELIPCGVLATDGRKKWILVDLRKPVEAISAKDITATLFSAESPFRVVRSNAAQLLVSDEIAEMLISREEMSAMRKTAELVKANTQLRAEASRAVGMSTFTQVENPTSEERIYDGFVKDSEKPRMNAFHNADTWLKRAQIVFEDDRLKDFAARIVLEAVIDGRATDVPEDLTQRLLNRCREAYERPFAPAESRSMSILKALTTNPPEAWQRWSESAFEGLSTILGRDATPEAARPIQTQFAFM